MSIPAGSLLFLHERENSLLNKKCLINQSPHDDVSISPMPWTVWGLAPTSHFPSHHKAGVIVHERRGLDVKPAEKYPSHFSFPINRYCFSSCFLILPLSRSPNPLLSCLSRILEPWTKSQLSYCKWIFEDPIAFFLQKGVYYSFYIIFPSFMTTSNTS